MKHGKVISVDELIDKTIQNYDMVLQSIQKEGFSFFVYGIPPAARQENIYRFPFYADQETRVFISRKFNEKLKEFCAKKNYRYLDVQSRFADASGLISKPFAADGIHLNEKAAAIIAQEIKIKLGRKTLQR
jgi:lysophospholipase L1-like esterase